MTHDSGSLKIFRGIAFQYIAENTFLEIYKIEVMGRTLALGLMENFQLVHTAASLLP